MQTLLRRRRLSGSASERFSGRFCFLALRWESTAKTVVHDSWVMITTQPPSHKWPLACSLPEEMSRTKGTCLGPPFCHQTWHRMAWPSLPKQKACNSLDGIPRRKGLSRAAGRECGEMGPVRSTSITLKLMVQSQRRPWWSHWLLWKVVQTSTS